MSRLYSNQQMKSLTIEDEDGNIRVYKGFKLAAKPLMTESFKLLKILIPSLGAITDGYHNAEYELPQTWMAAAQMLETNLKEEHFDDLVYKLTGSLCCNGKNIDDWDEHFDEFVYDLPEVLAWAGKENFADFFTRNHLVRSKWKMIKEKMSKPLQEILEQISSND